MIPNFLRILSGYLFGPALLVLGALTALPAMAANTEPLTINWHHKAQYLRPVIAEFTRESGIEVKVTDSYNVFDADVIVVPDYKTLTVAKQMYHFERIKSPDLDAIVPARWRDRDGYWYGLMLRARAVVYNKAQVKPGEIKRLQDLADPKWRGKIALRSAANVYNRSLLASIIVHQGRDAAREWARAVRANAGPNPEYLGDTFNIARVARGDFALTLVNTYYFGYMMSRGEEARLGVKFNDAVGIAWLEQEGVGQPVNVTGIGVNSKSERKQDGLKLVRFLLSRQGQALLTENVFKYPVRGDVEPSAWLKGYGSFIKDDLNLNDLELHYDEADGIFRAVDWAAWP